MPRDTRRTVGVLSIQSRQIIDPDFALVEFDIVEPIVVPPALLYRLNKPRIERAALHDFHMTVIAQQDRETDASEDQQQADVKYQQARLRAKLLFVSNAASRLSTSNTSGRS